MRNNIFKRVYHFYADGFKRMPGWGRYLWIIILVKVFIMFAILKVFFFPDVLKKNFSDDEQRGNYILEQLSE